MADIVMPVSVPCNFEKAWQGLCKKPTDNGWCSEHENRKCICCGTKAIKDCGETMGPFVCGVNLCGECVHSPSESTKLHIPKVQAQEIRAEQEREHERVVASRKDPKQRLNDQGMPMNTFEFLKGDKSGYEMVMVYSLDLSHGLMGYFPAVVHTEKRIIYATDLEVLRDVWKMLEPRKSKIAEIVGYYNKESGYAYLHPSEQYYRERAEPIRIFTREEFEKLKVQDPLPFEWAPGLFGDSRLSPESFAVMVQESVDSTMMGLRVR
ncbi:MAG: hypothetical protein V4690_01580 [Patescibacteria group bacterium]